MNDRFGLVLSIDHRTQVSGPERLIVMGSGENALAGKYARSLADVGASAPPGPEGYLLRVDRNRVVVVGSDDRGAFYGLQSLRQLLFKDG
ncbi:MAG TPA: glycoside hydrolase family 20 zincin-like fold domain-containing protein [Bryobacteraceae bacterium]|nr:glycoside hydrolase family 20 zincin-like fold domain-containing protein [Bryobacteraceae bacterium]